MTAVHTVPAVTAALIAQGTVTVITAAERGIDGRVLIRAGEVMASQAVAASGGTLTAYGELPGVVPLTLIPVNPGHIVASGTVEWVPIMSDGLAWPDLVACVFQRFTTGALLFYAEGEDEDPTLDLTNQLPYGDFTPGRWAGILTDVKPTTDRCPACWGSAVHGDEPPCASCDGLAFTTGHSSGCPPIPCDDVEVWP